MNNPLNQGPRIAVVSWTLAAVAILFVAARLYTRLFITRKPGWDDAFIFFSLLSALVCSALVQVGIHYGLGQHLMEISNEYDRIEAFKYTVIAPNFSIVSTTTGKISVVIFLLRLMGQAATKPKKYFLYGLTVLSIILNTMCIIILIGFCIPAKKIWIPSTPGHCMSLQTQLVIGETQASYNALTDVILAIFPAFIFWNIQLQLKVKVTLICIMGAGLFAAAATIVKCVLLKQLPDQKDITWAWAPITLWYSILVLFFRAEMYVIIICASLPTLRQFYLALLGRPLHDSEYYHSGSSKNRTPYGHSHQGGNVRLSSIMNRSGKSSRVDDPTLITVGGGQDDTSSSQENILPPGNAGGEIRKTTEVHVYASDGNSSSRGQEGHFSRSNPFIPH